MSIANFRRCRPCPCPHHEAWQEVDEEDGAQSNCPHLDPLRTMQREQARRVKAEDRDGNADAAREGATQNQPSTSNCDIPANLTNAT